MSSRRPRFSGHQTFPFRYGWLEKGCQYIKEGGRFSDADVLARLGTGKNMADSIRYWCDVFGLTDDNSITPFAEMLLDANDGLDPYLEDDASLWLLHWRLCSQSRFMTAATLLFGEMRKPEFSRQEWLEMLRLRQSQGQGKAASIPTLERDIECCLKMYAVPEHAGKNRVLELSYACPFQELDLLSVLEGGYMMRFSIGCKSGLPPEVVGFAISEYLQSEKRDAIRLGDLLYADYAPGQIFMLDEGSLVEAIAQLQQSPRWGAFFNLTSSEGIETVHCSLPCGDDLLRSYYKAAG